MGNYLNRECMRCNQSTLESFCPNCGNEQYCPDCKTCNICGPIVEWDEGYGDPKARVWSGRVKKWVYCGYRYMCPICKTPFGGKPDYKIKGEKVCIACSRPEKEDQIELW